MRVGYGRLASGTAVGREQGDGDLLARKGYEYIDSIS
jgi:hypothetical protein